MKNISIITLASCISLMLMPSCNRSKNNISQKKDSQACVGSWVANGSHPIGYSHGKYAIQLDLASDGTCKMKFQYDLNKTAMSDKFSDIVQLEGNWNATEGNVHTTMKVTNWVVTDLAKYRKEQSFDDFVTEFNFKYDGGKLIPGSKYSSSMKFGTTKDARDMNTLVVEGKGILLYNVEFSKK